MNLENVNFSMTMTSASLARHAAVMATFQVAIWTRADEEEAIVELLASNMRIFK